MKYQRWCKLYSAFKKKKSKLFAIVLSLHPECFYFMEAINVGCNCISVEIANWNSLMQSTSI